MIHILSAPLRDTFSGCSAHHQQITYTCHLQGNCRSRQYKRGRKVWKKGDNIYSKGTGTCYSASSNHLESNLKWKVIIIYNYRNKVDAHVSVLLVVLGESLSNKVAMKENCYSASSWYLKSCDRWCVGSHCFTYLQCRCPGRDEAGPRHVTYWRGSAKCRSTTCRRPSASWWPGTRSWQPAISSWTTSRVFCVRWWRKYSSTSSTVPPVLSASCIAIIHEAKSLSIHFTLRTFCVIRQLVKVVSRNFHLYETTDPRRSVQQQTLRYVC